MKGLGLRVLPAGQGHGLHRVWVRGGLWDELSLLSGLSALFSSPPFVWGCWGTSGSRWEHPGWPDLDLCLSIRRMDLVWVREAPGGPIGAAADSECEKRPAKVASSAGPIQSPFPLGPRNWEALCRQEEKPSWKEGLGPLVCSSLAFLCKKTTVCSRTSAFSTLCCVPSCRERQQLNAPLETHWKSHIFLLHFFKIPDPSMHLLKHRATPAGSRSFCEATNSFTNPNSEKK